MIVVDIERPVCPTVRMLDIVSIDPHAPAPVHQWRHANGLRIGKFMGGRKGGYLYSVLDVGEIAIIVLLRALAVPLDDAIKQARRERAKLKTVLIARLEQGYWPLALVRADLQEPIPAARGFSLSQLAERLIDKLGLPLPIVDVMPPKDEAMIIVQIVARYIASAEFDARCQQFRKEVLARKRPTNWTEASVRLGVPLWLIVEGVKGIAEEAEEAAAGDVPPISIAHVLRERLGVDIVEAAP
jgi:hypothetical protein